MELIQILEKTVSSGEKILNFFCRLAWGSEIAKFTILTSL